MGVEGVAILLSEGAEAFPTRIGDLVGAAGSAVFAGAGAAALGASGALAGEEALGVEKGLGDAGDSLRAKGEGRSSGASSVSLGLKGEGDPVFFFAKGDFGEGVTVAAAGAAKGEGEEGAGSTEGTAEAGRLKGDPADAWIPEA